MFLSKIPLTVVGEILNLLATESYVSLAFVKANKILNISNLDTLSLLLTNGFGSIKLLLQIEQKYLLCL